MIDGQDFLARFFVVLVFLIPGNW